MSKQTPQTRVLFPHCRKPVGLLVFGVFLFLSIFIALIPQTATAAPANLNFQARLMTATGAIVPDGNYNIEFKLYNVLSSSGSSQGACTGDAACLWSETRTGANVVQVKNGYLTVNLGSVTAFGAVDFSQQLWLTMRVGGTGTPTWDPEMNPRLQLTAVPYAFKAGDSATLGGIASSGFIQNQTASPQAASGFNISGNGLIGGNATVTGTYNTNTFTANTLTFGDASNPANINAGSGQTLNLAGNSVAISAASTQSILIGTTNSNTITLGTTTATSTITVGRSTGTNTINIGSGNTSTGNTQSINIGAGTPTGTGSAQIGIGNGNGNSSVAVTAANGGITLATNSSTTGTLVKSLTNSVSALQVQNSTSVVALNVDTSNGRVGIGNKPTPAYTLDVAGDINTSTAYRIGGTIGASTSCGSGNFLQNQIVSGGITTGGTCAAAGTASTIQDAYNGSGATNPQIQLSNANGGLKIRDAASSTIGNLFQLQNSGGTVTYFGVTASGLSIQNASATSALTFDSVGGHLKIYNPSSASNYADIYYDNVNNQAVFAASAGNTTRVGGGSGNIQLTLTNSADVLIGTKTLTLAGAYSANDYRFTRNLTGAANAITGRVFSIEDLSSGSADASTILYLNQNNSSPTGGNLIQAQKNGADSFKVDTNGTTTIAAGQSYTGVGAVTLSSGSGTVLTLNGPSGINLQANGVTAVNLGATGDLTTTGYLYLGNNKAISYSGNDVLKYDSGFNVTSVSNYAVSGAVNVQADSFHVQDTTGYNNNLIITNTGATTFQNRVNSVSAFQVQNSSGVAQLTTDTTNARIILGTSGGDTTGTILVLGNKTTAGDPTGVNGAIYYNSNSKSFRCQANGFWQSCLSGLRYAQGSIAGGDTISNTTTETNFTDNYTIPANDCVVGRVYRITSAGTYNYTGTPDINIRIKFGATVLGDGPTTRGGITTNNSSAAGWQITATITCISATTVEVDGLFSSAGQNGTWFHQPIYNTANAVTLSGTNVLQLAAKWSVAAAGNTITMRQFIVESLGPK